jgi:hypothetical protein
VYFARSRQPRRRPSIDPKTGMQKRLPLAAVLTAVLALATAPAASAYLCWTDNDPGLSSAGTTIARANLDASGVTAVHAASSGAGSFCAGTATTFVPATGGGSGAGTGTGGTGTGTGGMPPPCRVPKLTGKSLAAARTLLVRAHCRVGKVIWPRIRKGRKLVVHSERPGAGRVPANSAKVELWLGPPAKRRRHTAAGVGLTAGLRPRTSLRCRAPRPAGWHPGARS